MSRSGYLPLDDFTTVTILDSTRSPSLHGAPPAVSASSTPALTGWPGGEAEERSLQVAPPPDQPRVEIFIALRLFRAEDAAAAIIFRPACTLSSGLVFFFFFTADYRRPRPFQAASTPHDTRVHLRCARKGRTKEMRHSITHHPWVPR